MPSKRSRPPGLSDGAEFTSAAKAARTPSKSKPSAPRGGRKGASTASSRSAVKTAPKPKQNTKKSDNRIKVGVDFGTTNSGVAHVLAANHDASDIEVITNWPGGIRNNEQLEKVPSRIAFKAENEDMDEDKWGYEVPPGSQSYSWFKLLLDADAERTVFDSNNLTSKMEIGLLDLPEDMTAEGVAAAYLSKLYRHTMEALERSHTAAMLEATPIDFWFTVPATWQESAIDATRTAAEKAGFGSRKDDELNIITEPEAAAIAMLSKTAEKYSHCVKVGTNILMLDLGGGTIDAQALTLTQIKPQLQTEETIHGIGGKSGSTYIDRNFHAWMESTFGDAFKKLSRSKIGTGSKFMNDFEVVKKGFTGRDLKKKHQIPLPSLGAAMRAINIVSTSYDFEDYCVLVTGAEIADMFEPVVEKTFAIVDEISDMLVKEGLAGFRIICLAGGLGSSEYIWDRFKQYNQEKLNGECHFCVDDRAWSAVVRGAAVRGLSGSLVLSKRAKRAYGLGVHWKFREGKDDEKDAFDCPFMGKRASNRATWPVRVGQKFEENLRIKASLYITIPEDAEDEDLVLKWNLLSCALKDPPEEEGHKDVKKEGSITLDLRKTYKRSKRNDESHDGHEAVELAIVFKMGNERGTLVVEALHGRKVVGTAKIDYARTHARQIVSSSAGLLDG